MRNVEADINPLEPPVNDFSAQCGNYFSLKLHDRWQSQDRTWLARGDELVVVEFARGRLPGRESNFDSLPRQHVLHVAVLPFVVEVMIARAGTMQRHLILSDGELDDFAGAIGFGECVSEFLSAHAVIPFDAPSDVDVVH